MSKHAVSKQALRYLLVGLLVYALDIGLYALLIALAPDAYLAANLISKSVAAAAGFFLHRSFTFSWDQQHDMGRQLVSYLLLLGFNLLLSSVMLFLLVDSAGLGEMVGKLLTDVVVIGVAFVASRWLVFTRQANANGK